MAPPSKQSEAAARQTVGFLVGSLLGSAASFPINLPAGVPPSLRITGLSLNANGLTLSAAATDATFSK